jgi:hypothetical protein
MKRPQVWVSRFPERLNPVWEGHICSLITKEKIGASLRGVQFLRSHLKSKTNLHPRPNIKLGMGYFTLLMYKTVIDRGYKSCLQQVIAKVQAQ